MQFHYYVFFPAGKLDIYDGHLRHIKFLVQQLDKYQIIPHTVYNRVRKNYSALETVEITMEKIFGRYLKPTSNGLSTEEKRFLRKLSVKAANNKVSEIVWRMEQAVTETAEAGWYTVFNTLTVSPDQYKNVFSPGSKAWRNYIQKVERAVIKATYGSIKRGEEARKQGKLCHQYIAVVERSPRLHIHVLHMMEKLPKGSTRDPNLRTGPPVLRCLYGFGKFWPHGFQKPIAVRFTANDAYTKAGWKWPHEKNDDGQLVAIKAKPPIAIARYLAKYISKAYLTKRKEGFRCRMTRNLGLTKLDQIIKNMGDESLIGLISLADPTPLKAAKIRIPPLSLVRKSAAKEILTRMPPQKAWTYLRGLTRRQPIIEQWRTMTQKKQRRRSSNTTDITTRNWTTTAISKEIRETFNGLNKNRKSQFNPAGPKNITR